MIACLFYFLEIHCFWPIFRHFCMNAFWWFAFSLRYAIMFIKCSIFLCLWFLFNSILVFLCVSFSLKNSLTFKYFNLIDIMACSILWPKLKLPQYDDSSLLLYPSMIQQTPIVIVFVSMHMDIYFTKVTPNATIAL